METVNLHEAKTHLSRLVEKAVQGEPFIIARAGEPLVKVVALGTPETSPSNRLGFMMGEIDVPDDFDQFGTQGNLDILPHLKEGDSAHGG